MIIRPTPNCVRTWVALERMTAAEFWQKRSHCSHFHILKQLYSDGVWIHIVFHYSYFLTYTMQFSFWGYFICHTQWIQFLTDNELQARECGVKVCYQQSDKPTGDQNGCFPLNLSKVGVEDFFRLITSKWWKINFHFTCTLHCKVDIIMISQCHISFQGDAQCWSLGQSALLWQSLMLQTSSPRTTCRWDHTIVYFCQILGELKTFVKFSQILGGRELGPGQISKNHLLSWILPHSKINTIRLQKLSPVMFYTFWTLVPFRCQPPQCWKLPSSAPQLERPIASTSLLLSSARCPS